jgi:hypothetical protein
MSWYKKSARPIALAGCTNPSTIRDMPPHQGVNVDYTTLRFLKWIAMFLLVSGTLAAFTSSRLEDRQRAAYWMATPGFVLTWVIGYIMAEKLMISLGSPWISVTMMSSLAALAITVWSVERNRAMRWIPAIIAIGALTVGTGAMTYKLGGTVIKTAGGESEIEVRP